MDTSATNTTSSSISSPVTVATLVATPTSTLLTTSGSFAPSPVHTPTPPSATTPGAGSGSPSAQPAVVVASSDEPAGAVSTTTSATATPQTSTTTSTLTTTTTTTTTTSSSAVSSYGATTNSSSCVTATSVATVTATSVPVASNGVYAQSTTVPVATSIGTTGTGTGGGGGGSLPPPSGKTGTTDKGGLPKAMIKPNVLTHVIEGYVIQEATDPFPVQRQRYPERDANDEPPKKRTTNESNSPISPNQQPGSLAPPTSDMGNCEICGKPELRSKMKRKRFCSVDCARAAKQNSTDQVTSPSHNGTGGVGGETHPTSTHGNGLEHASSVTTTVNPVAPSNIKLERSESMDTTPSAVHPPQFAATPMETGAATVPMAAAVPLAAAAAAEDTPIIMKWTVNEVCEFIKNLPGCSDYAEDFAIQEIDGQALLLLKENHLVNAMGMKLGPALKIVARVQALIASTTPDGQQQQSQQ